MAKQVGPVFFTGTIDGLIFYKIGDKYYTRSKGSYKSAKHMRRNPKYKRTMQKADQFGTASKLVREVYYRHVPKALRKQGLFGKLTGMATTLFQEGKKKDEVIQKLINYCASLSTTNSLLPTSTTKPAMKIDQSTPLNTQPPTNNKQLKKARYLSNWKVKRNGRLYIPLHQTAACLPPVMALSCHPAHDPEFIEGRSDLSSENSLLSATPHHFVIPGNREKSQRLTT